MKPCSLAHSKRFRQTLPAFLIFLLLGFVTPLLVSSCSSARSYPTPTQSQQLKHQKKSTTKYGRTSKGKLPIKQNYVIKK